MLSESELEVIKDKSLLVLTHDVDVLKLTEKSLKYYIYNTHFCTEPNDLEELTKTLSPDIILMEWQLVQENIIRFVKQMRAEYNQIAFIVLVEYANLEKCVALSEYGGVLYLDTNDLKDAKIINAVYKASRIVEQKRFVQEQFNLLNQYKSAVDISAVVSKTDPEGLITYVNDRFCAISGYRVEELIGKNHNIIRHPETPKKVFRDLWSTVLSGQVWQGIIKNKNRDGEAYMVDSTIIPLTNRYGEVVEFISIRHDVTEMHRAKERAEEERVAKEQFLANMSHEIRTPLNAILGFVGLLKERITEGVEAKYIDTINSSGKVLLNVINDILDFAKIEKGKLEIETISFLVQLEFQSVIELFSANAREKSVNLLLHIDEKVPRCIVSDPFRLKQVISNLLSNAIKFTPEGKSVTLDVRYQTEERILEVSVIDEGIGIPEENQKNIFEAFTQTDATITRKFGGTGLGLSICSSIIQLLEGTISLESKEGVGSKFYFRIPVQEGNCSQISEQVESSQSIDFEMLDYSDKRILVVEDNMPNMLYIQIILEKTGAHLDLVANGQKALERFRVDQYDLILLDENMPGMRGSNVAKEMRRIEEEKQQSHTPVVAMTAMIIHEDKNIYEVLGMDDYISKPLEAGRLYELLCHYLGARYKEGVDAEFLSTEQSIVQAQEKLTMDEIVASLGMDREDAEALVSVYKESALETLELFEEGIAAADFEVMNKAVHKLAGSMGYMLGLEEVNSLAKECENLTQKREEYDYESYLSRMQNLLSLLP